MMRTTIGRTSPNPLTSRGFLADSISWMSTSDYGVVGPVLGAPAAVVALEPLLAAGAKQVVLFGLAGALVSEDLALKIGDIVCPGWALAEHNTSVLYGDGRPNETCDGSLQAELRTLLGSNLTTDKPLGVWTTDAPYRETATKVEHYRTKGINLVDMEYAALLQLTNTYKAQLAAAFVISDTFTNKWEAGFSRKIVKQQLGVIADAVVEMLAVFPDRAK